LIQVAAELSASGTTATIVGPSNISGVAFSQLPPPLRMRAAFLAGLWMLIVVSIPSFAAAQRTRRLREIRTSRFLGCYKASPHYTFSFSGVVRLGGRITNSVLQFNNRKRRSSSQIARRFRVRWNKGLRVRSRRVGRKAV